MKEWMSQMYLEAAGRRERSCIAPLSLLSYENHVRGELEIKHKQRKVRLRLTCWPSVPFLLSFGFVLGKEPNLVSATCHYVCPVYSRKVSKPGNRSWPICPQVVSMSDYANYAVGWICALATEYVATQECPDEEHEGSTFISLNDTNDYTLGKTGEHNIVIAVLPDGEYGTASATNVATVILNNFPSVRFGLVVGISGGVPSEKHDVRLGDVVVSAPRNGEGGVL
jgi:hypothetical protein